MLFKELMEEPESLIETLGQVSLRWYDDEASAS